MAYICDLNPGHQVYLDNQGNQTIVTTTMGLPGQQQQTSNSMMTGPWTAPPEAYRMGAGAVFKLSTAQGEVCIQIQGNSVTMASGSATAGASSISMQPTTTPPARPMQPMQSMPPMGNMSMPPMEMRMGNMEMRMDAAAVPAAESTSRQFCSQCGTKVAREDRFCSSCGHALG